MGHFREVILPYIALRVHKTAKNAISSNNNRRLGVK